MIVHIGPEFRGAGDERIGCVYIISNNSADPALEQLSKEKFRLDDDVGSGPVYIQAACSTYPKSSIKLTAREYAGKWSMWDYSYYWPETYKVVRGSFHFPDYLPQPQLPQNLLWRWGIIVDSSFSIPANAVYDGSPPVTGTAYYCLQANHWWYSDPYDMRMDVYIHPTVKVPTSGDPNYYYCDVRCMAHDILAYDGESLESAWSRFSDPWFLREWCLSTEGGRWEWNTAAFFQGAEAEAIYRNQSYLLNVVGPPGPLNYPDRDEFSFWMSRANGIVCNGLGIIQARYFSKAFDNAFDKLPQVQQSMVANIIDCVSSLQQFLKKPSISTLVGKGPKEWWLSYRYSYSTTKMDIEELGSIASRLLSLGDVCKSYGSYISGNINYHCLIVVDAKHFLPTEAEDVLGRLRLTGLQVETADVWDMIPYSFVVDWFLDVSGLLTSFDRWLSASKLPIKECWYSCVSNYTDSRYVYFRFSGSPPKLPSFSLSTSKSGSTWLKRILDVISLY